MYLGRSGLAELALWDLLGSEGWEEGGGRSSSLEEERGVAERTRAAKASLSMVLVTMTVVAATRGTASGGTKGEERGTGGRSRAERPR